MRLTLKLWQMIYQININKAALNLVAVCIFTEETVTGAGDQEQMFQGLFNPYLISKIRLI